MVLREYRFEIVCEGLCVFGVKVCDVGNEVDDLLEGLDGIGGGGGWRD
jgi:hypothetical protein